MHIRNSILALLIAGFIGCAFAQNKTNNELLTATIDDTFVRINNSSANLFYVAAINGKSVSNGHKKLIGIHAVRALT
ncbi:hypothetical protein [Halioxenophilus sp. WMMB6]|uniref:hypothetical protein n=1 Tax=Halioxenophilus sp. WMMB6 TaxID=3073815 RepID=UPI00295EC18B|nr:hypothetical protein [Halioxenophilus sp. WMMB6]